MIPKFDPKVHSGTKYDPATGTRVPVTDPNELPKIANSGLNPFSDLQVQAALHQQRMQMQMLQMSRIHYGGTYYNPYQANLIYSNSSSSQAETSSKDHHHHSSRKRSRSRDRQRDSDYRRRR